MGYKNALKVALLLPWHVKLAHNVVLGMNDYMRNKHQWHFMPELNTAGNLKKVLSWDLDGIVVGLSGEEMFSMAAKSKIPIVSIHGSKPVTGIHHVCFDQNAIGKIAANYFIKLGYRHFGFVGIDGAGVSQMAESFGIHIALAGFKNAFFKAPAMRPFECQKPLSKWLKELPQPAAILCCHDLWALYVRICCCNMGLDIPDKIAVLGVGNDEMNCENFDPMGSSINLQHKLVGFKAAEVLLNLIRHPRAKARSYFLPPGSVVQRQSTGVFAVRDSAVQAALLFIHDNAMKSISVGDVADAAGICSRVLQRRFKLLLGRAPHTEILRRRMQMAMKMLEDRSIKIDDVALRCGFSSGNYMCDVFAREAGLSPGSYRKQVSTNGNA